MWVGKWQYELSDNGKLDLNLIQLIRFSTCVKLDPSRPLSKRKNWVVAEILKKARIYAPPSAASPSVAANKTTASRGSSNSCSRKGLWLCIELASSASQVRFLRISVMGDCGMIHEDNADVKSSTNVSLKVYYPEVANVLSLVSPISAPRAYNDLYIR
ncbi:hypothetical protein Tco_0525267 [Tanacetum coccineum]